MDKCVTNLNAIDFFNEKGREFRNEFSSLFSSYKSSLPVNGANIAKLINQYGSEFSEKVSDILLLKNDNYLGIGSGKWKAAAGKAAGAFKKYKELKAGELSETEDLQPEKKSKKDKKILGLSAPIAIGIGAIIFLVIIFIVIKKAS